MTINRAFDWPPSQGQDDPEFLREQANELVARVQDLRIRADEIEKRNKPAPSESYPEGTVITFQKRINRLKRGAWRSCPLDYAAIKAGGKWFLTGKTQHGMSWHSLLNFIGAVHYASVRVAIGGPVVVPPRSVFGQ